MQANSFVVVNLHSPKERFVGRLIEIGAPGVTLRGLDLMSFDDWMHDVSNEEESGVRPTTIFFPLHRVEKIMLDENLGGIPSLGNTFLTTIGASIDDYLE
jgi:hypothetical protein